MLRGLLAFALLVSSTALLACASDEGAQAHDRGSSSSSQGDGAKAQGPRVKLPSGASVPALDRWASAEESEVVTLTGPDGETTVAIVERTGLSTEEALAEVVPELAADLEGVDKQTLTPPPDKGFDEIRVETYDFAGEPKVAQVVAFRKGEQVWVFLVRGPLAAISRRSAQLREIMGGLEAEGVAEESLAGKDPGELDDTKQAQLAAFLAEARREIGVPGAAIAVVKDGDVVWSEGFGALEEGGEAKVTPQTRMMIGSITKSMSTLLMADLVAGGQLAWDAKVRKLYPAFKMGDEELSEKIEARHLVCACTGVPRRDFELLFEYADITPEKLVAHMATFEPTTGFGETFQYSNQMVAVGGYLAGHLAYPDLALGPAYDRAMNERVFQPLMLQSATLDFADLREGDHAIPHSRNLDGEWVALPVEMETFVRPLRPSGGVWMSTEDLARYVASEIRRGQAPGSEARVANAEQVEKRWEPQVKASADTSYGLGWLSAEDRGLRVISHSGGTFGFNAYAVFVPELGLGMASIVNGSGGHAWNQVAWQRLLELLLGAEEQAQERLSFARETYQKQIDEVTEGLEPLKPDSERAKSLLGTWSSPQLGRVLLQPAMEGVNLDVGEWTSPLAQKTEDDKRFLVLTGPPVAGLSLEVKERAGETVLVLQEAQTEHVFRRAEELAAGPAPSSGAEGSEMR